MRPVLFLIGVALLVPFVGCATTKDAGDLSNLPDWVLRPAGVYEDENGVKALYAVGAADPSPSVTAQRTWALDNGRQELAAGMATHVQRMITTYMREAVDKYNVEDTASLITNNEAVSRAISQATLLGAQPINTTQDPKTGVLYFHMRMPLDTNFLKAYQSEAKAAMREQFAKYSKEIKDKALDDLDAAVSNNVDEMKQDSNPYENP